MTKKYVHWMKQFFSELNKNTLLNRECIVVIWNTYRNTFDIQNKATLFITYILLNLSIFIKKYTECNVLKIYKST